ncbi:putative alcohol dehydrogenase GroES-like domain [Lyophyllum shimeji]|uniref:Alcohol dehydrogenase GroES-like domain n=1 Tax=Lyophyllum shimeji TaxID=47721 RepID=A0A9P3PRI4_LYOSH|nr:putative alcohol dehydrogenase GroES-like domain [Lyophyllum shimeji]
MPGTQKALFLESKFGQYTLRERDIPTPGRGQLLVQIRATGLNPVDWKLQKYGFFIENFPAIVGTDIAGVVEEIGEGVSGYAKGDRVLFQGQWENNKAGYQQYTIADAETTAKMPPDLSFEEAATVTVALAAAITGLYLPKPHGAGFTSPFDVSNRGKYSGKPIVVLGGATSVGQYVIQSAKISGFSPIITTASLKHEKFLKSLGATHVLDRQLSSASLKAETARITSAPIDIVYDAVSRPDTQEAGLGLLRSGGSLVVVLSPVVKATDGKDVIHTAGMWTFPHSRALGVQLYSALTELLDKGLIKPNRVEVLSGGLNGVVGGLARLEADQVSGVKLVVRPQETD